MSAGLSITADPVDLIPGSTEALYDDARALESSAEELEGAAAGVRRRTVASWVGDAADGWDERRPQLAEAMEAPAEVYRSAAEVLRAHAGMIEWAREECHVAIALWRKGEAERSYDGLQCLAGSPPMGAPQQTVVEGQRWSIGLDPGYETRMLALQVLEAAREEVRLSAEAAAALLDTWCADLPDGQFHAGDFWGGVWSWVCAIGTLLRTYNAARVIYDPGGYAHDVGAAAQGVQDVASHLAANPNDVNRVVLDSETWRDHPGRWWGSIAPELALSVAGGGAGVVSRVGRAADIPNGVAKVPRLWGRDSSVAGGGGNLTDDVVRQQAQMPVSAVHLRLKLASEAQMAEPGLPIAGAPGVDPLREADRLAAMYGGDPEDWRKMTSKSYREAEVGQFETHWYENSETGLRVEWKTKFPERGE